MSLLTTEEHNNLVNELGFKKVKARCPVCYTEQLIEKRIREAIMKLPNDNRRYILLKGLRLNK